jgi:hypothetical protein
MARQALLDDVRVNEASVRATCRGFYPLKVKHSREVLFQPREITIHDAVVGRPGSEMAVARFHFHPTEDPEVVGGDRVMVAGLTLSCLNASAMEKREYLYAPEFNRRIPGKVIEVRFTDQLTTLIHL